MAADADALLQPCGEPGQFLPRRPELHRVVAGVQPVPPVLEVVAHPSFHATKVLQLYPRDDQWWIGLSIVDAPLVHIHHRKADAPPIALSEDPAPKVEFHERVREGYHLLALADPARWYIADATEPVEMVTNSIWQRIEPLLAAR